MVNNTMSEKKLREVDLTFISLTYNQSAIVVEHLESLLFQVKTNLGMHRVQLVISDDASTDLTVDNINKWLAVNSHYFDSVELLTSQKNQGTCKSFVKAINHAKGRYIKALAGDDMYLKTDMSEAISLLSTYDIVLTPSLPFYGNDIGNTNKLKFEKSRFAIKCYLSLGYNKIKERLTPAPETPGVFYNRHVFTEKVVNFISRYDLIEDRSFWISVLEENRNLAIGVNDNPFIGYRQHSESVSKGAYSPVTVRYKKDQRMLSIYQIKNCKSYFFKVIHAYDLFFSQINFKYKRFFNLRVLIFNFSFFRFLLFNKIKYYFK